MTSQQFPKVDSEGRFVVRIGLQLFPPSGAKDAEKIGRWLIDQWLPANRTWRRKWANGQNALRNIEEELLFSDSFYSYPEVSYRERDTLCVVLHGKSRSALWRDWMISKIIPELKEEFPNIGDRLFVENAD